jgi:hypothetical protein
MSFRVGETVKLADKEGTVLKVIGKVTEVDRTSCDCYYLIETWEPYCLEWYLIEEIKNCET